MEHKSVVILKRLLDGETVTFEGRDYILSGETLYIKAFAYDIVTGEQGKPVYLITDFRLSEFIAMCNHMPPQLVFEDVK